MLNPLIFPTLRKGLTEAGRKELRQPYGSRQIWRVLESGDFSADALPTGSPSIWQVGYFSEMQRHHQLIGMMRMIMDILPPWVAMGVKCLQ